MRNKQSGPVRSEFYTFSPVRSIWSGPKIIHYQTKHLLTYLQGLIPTLAGVIAYNIYNMYIYIYIILSLSTIILNSRD